LFAHAKRQRRFLEFIVSETLAGRADRISAYSVGIGVYDRDDGFDPMLNPIVRVEAQRLRAKLREYYDEEGLLAPIRIGLNKGSYAATIRWDGLVVERASKRAQMAEKPSLAVLPFAADGPTASGGIALPMASRRLDHGPFQIAQTCRCLAPCVLCVQTNTKGPQEDRPGPGRALLAGG